MTVRIQAIDAMEILITNMDDSVGEAFDKTVKMMGLGYLAAPSSKSSAPNTTKPSMSPRWPTAPTTPP